jgi:hypothetical protein
MARRRPVARRWRALDTARAAIQAQGLCGLATVELATSPQRRPHADNQDEEKM